MIYLAHCPSVELRKGFSRADDGSLNEHKPAPKLFRYERRSLRSLDDVQSLLAELVDAPHTAIVMGEPNAAGDLLANDGERTRRADDFQPLATRFWFIDLDGVPGDGDAPAIIERALPFLHGKSYVYAFSQSAGIKDDGLRCRVICELDRPHSPGELSAYARHYNDHATAYEGIKRAVIDAGIYAPSRLLFTARPRLDGIADPHPERVFMVRGDSNTPVTLDRLPDRVEIETRLKEVVSDLPELEGFGLQGRGRKRNNNAYWGLRYLRTFMEREDNEHDWDDLDNVERLWHQMLEEAGATDYERRKYRDYWRKRRPGLRAADQGKTITAIANPDNSIPLARAETMLSNYMREAIESRRPQVTCIKVTMGTGKTYQALCELLAERGRICSQIEDFYVDWYAPLIETQEQTLATAKGMGLDGFVEYGREQIYGGRPVCTKAEAAKHISPAVENTAASICEDKNGKRCADYDRCRWQWQRNDTLDLSLRIRNHQHLGHVVRSERNQAFRPIDLVIIDEDFTDKLINNSSVAIADLVSPARGLSDEAWPWVQKFGDLLRDGLTIDALREAGFDDAVCRMLIKAEEALAPVIDVHPGMSPEASLRAAQRADKTWLTYASVWRRLRDCIRSGSMNRIHRPEGQDFIVLNWRSEIKSIPFDKETGRPTVPVIIMSGTMDRDVIEQFIPVDVWHEIDVEPHPGAHIRQSDLRGSKSECLYGSSEERQAAGETDAKKTKAAAEIRRQVKEAAEGSTLITFMEFEDLEGADAHFMATEGRNDFTGRALTLYGRPLPAPHVIEDMTRAVYQDDPAPVRSLKNFYPRRPVARRGEGYSDAEYHPDPRCERLRWLVCEGELMQAVARCRYVRYPVSVTILSRTPLPLRIDQVVQRYRLHPDWRRFDEGRILPLSAREAVRLFPGAFSDTRSAKREIERRAVDFHEQRKAFLIEYRRKGARGRWNRALVDGWAAIKDLGPLEQVRMADDARNDFTVAFRDMRDAIMRGCLPLPDADEIEVMGALVPVPVFGPGASPPFYVPI